MKRNKVLPLSLILVFFFGCGKACDKDEIEQKKRTETTLSVKPVPVKEVTRMEKVRIPAVAGAFYPGNPQQLTSQVDLYLSQATSPDLEGDLIALISPHAGYVYSGPVAAYAYKLLENRQFDTVVVVAPSHYVGFQGLSIFDGDGYETPLGIVPIDRELSKKLINSSPYIQYKEAAHLREHSLEVQIPFLQRTLHDFKLVAAVMGNQDWESCQVISKALVEVLSEEKNVLLVASSDLSHFHPYAVAVELDQMVVDYVSNYDPKGLSKALSARKCEACGGGPIMTVMLAARELGADKARVLKYANSGDTAGDKSRVVGYMAAAITGKRRKTPEPVEEKEGLSDQEKKTLLKLARNTINQVVRGEKVTGLSEGELTDQLKEIRGAFVTIKKHGRLRGCIGHIVGREPLYLTVRDMAKSAALEDPRFSPVLENELQELELEISALTPLKKVEDPSKIEVGKHGLLIRMGWRSGVLLPQVPVEYNWDRVTFLEHTCQKAGLPPDAWKNPDAELFCFSAEVFN